MDFSKPAKEKTIAVWTFQITLISIRVSTRGEEYHVR
jgi:hypothetical protein